MANKVNEKLDSVASKQLISQYTIQRLPFYLDYLKQKQKEGFERVSAPRIAHDLELNEVQVKKDLAVVTRENGKPKTGHNLSNLIEDLESFLGYNNKTQAVLIGAGNLGKALLSFHEFNTYGLSIACAFDSNPRIVGNSMNHIEVMDIKTLEDYCRNHAIHIGIITVGSESAQSIANKLVECGVLAIWNFAPIHLNVPDEIIVQNENMACSLAVLSHRLQKVMEEQKEELK